MKRQGCQLLEGMRNRRHGDEPITSDIEQRGLSILLMAQGFLISLSVARDKDIMNNGQIIFSSDRSRY
jgi:ABC-type branched-subunit amino acid transport system ATPase component